MYFNIHALHTLPPSNPNRDDTQAPKTAIVGGVVRGRMSSQSQKRAARLDAQAKFPDLFNGVRTRELVPALAAAIAVKHPDVDALEIARAAATRLSLYKPKGDGKTAKTPKPDEDVVVDDGSAQALYYSAPQLAAFADLAPEIAAAEGKPGDKASAAYAERVFGNGHGMEIALFGRMVANSNISVESAVQTGHAYAVHATTVESDYFTFVDDLAQGSGAAHLGSTDFYSATFYRYANINVEQLCTNVGEKPTAEELAAGIRAYVKSWLLTLPQGHATQFAHNTLPDFIAIEVSNTPFTWTNAVNKPVSATDAVNETLQRFDALRTGLLAAFPEDVLSYGLFTTSVNDDHKLAKGVSGSLDESITRALEKLAV